MIANLQSHYGFTRMPFTKDIPVSALFSSAACKEAAARLRWLISARGLGVITGEVGSGKTASLRAAVDGLDASRHALVYLPNPHVGVRGIHGALATALGKAPCFYTSDLIPQVEAALAAEADERNRNVILAIDLCRIRDYADGSRSGHRRKQFPSNCFGIISVDSMA
jgi:type II secretory pathway predicted ATPase ExeA